MQHRPARMAGLLAVVVGAHVVAFSAATAGGSDRWRRQPPAVTVRLVTVNATQPVPSPAMPDVERPPPEPAAPVPNPDAPEPPQPPAALPASPFSAYRPSAELERPAFPRSSPDSSVLDGVSSSGFPIRLRVFVSHSGAVTGVTVLQAVDDDADMVARLRDMLERTAYLPARHEGADVPSYIDMEFSVSDMAP